MSITVHRDVPHRRLVARAEGSLTIDAVLHFLRTARASRDDQDWPLLFDASGASSAMTDDDVDAAVALVRQALEREGLRAHVAMVADEDALFDWMVRYEAKCVGIGVNVIRAFRRLPDAENWLEIMAAARRFHP